MCIYIEFFLIYIFRFDLYIYINSRVIHTYHWTFWNIIHPIIEFSIFILFLTFPIDLQLIFGWSWSLVHFLFEPFLFAPHLLHTLLSILLLFFLLLLNASKCDELLWHWIVSPYIWTHIDLHLLFLLFVFLFMFLNPFLRFHL